MDTIALPEASPPLHQKLSNYLEANRPKETLPTLFEIDIESHLSAGRTTWVVDAENTFVKQGGWTVEDSYLDWFDELRRAEGSEGQKLERLIIGTNGEVHSAEDLIRLQAWAEQIEADLVFTPLSPNQRKPSPYLYMAAMQTYGLHSEQILGIGDKASADVLAANLAGVYSIELDPLGDDLVGDAVLRRPAEKATKWFISRYPGDPFKSQVNVRHEQTDVLFEPAVDLADNSELEVSPSGKPAYLENLERIRAPHYFETHSRVAGFGRPALELTPENLKQLPPPPFNAVRSVIHAPAAAVTGTHLFKRYHGFLVEHGEDYGELMTRIRYPLGVAAGIATALGHDKLAATLVGATHVTDHQDGYGIRVSGADLKSERRIKGANDDRRADQFVTFCVGAGLIIREHRSKNGATQIPIFTADMARVAFRNWQVDKGKKSGFDTKADMPSKAANELLGLAQFMDVLRPRSNVAKMTRATALVARYGTLAISERVIWPNRKVKSDAAAHYLGKMIERATSDVDLQAIFASTEYSPDNGLNP